MPSRVSSRVSPKILGLAASVVALLLALSTGSTALREIRLQTSGVRATGRVASYTIPNDRTEGARVEVDVERPGGAPFRVHLVNASRGRWEEGMEVPLVCAELQPETRSCEVAAASLWVLPTAATAALLALIFVVGKRFLGGRRRTTVE